MIKTEQAFYAIAAATMVSGHLSIQHQTTVFAKTLYLFYFGLSA
jgi:hypothetical protein